MPFSVIFDIDGVIVDNSHFHQLAWKAFCSQHTIYFSEEEFLSNYFGSTNEQVLPLLFNRVLSKKEIDTLSSEKEELYRNIYNPHLKPVYGLIDFLDELKRNKIKVGAATSASPENVKFVFEGLGIKHFFDVIIDDSMVTKGKPNPEVYLLAAQKLNSDPKHCLVFEDSLSGTKAAFDAGSIVIGVTTTLRSEKHKYVHYLISDFTEISVNLIKHKFFTPDK